MLEKLRENPSAVVAGLVAAGVLAIAVGAGGQDGDNPSTDVAEGDDTSVVEEAENTENNKPTTADPEALLDEAQEEAIEELVANEPQEGPVVVNKEDTALSATVRTGDNQTLIVRQMVDDYASRSARSFSAEQRLYIETNVVNTIPRDDLIFADDVVSIEEQTIADYADLSDDLSDKQLALWAAYL